MINPELLDTILLEWSYRLKDGIPDVNDPEKVKVLNQVLAENKLPTYTDLLEVSTGAEKTDQQESLVCYFYDIICKYPKFISKYHDFLTKSKSMKKDDFEYAISSTLSGLQEATETIDASYMQLLADILDLAGPVEPDDDRYGYDKLNMFSIIENDKSDHRQNQEWIAQQFSQARTIYENANPKFKKYGLISRGELFNSIKDKAVTSIQQLYKLPEFKYPDNWCPADVFLMTESDGENADKAPTVNLDGTDRSINSYFYGSDNPKGEILAVSLKMETARAGKGTTFLKNVVVVDADNKLEKKGTDEDTKNAVKFDEVVRYIGENGKYYGPNKTEPITSKTVQDKIAKSVRIVFEIANALKIKYKPGIALEAATISDKQGTTYTKYRADSVKYIDPKKNVDSDPGSVKDDKYEIFKDYEDKIYTDILPVIQSISTKMSSGNKLSDYKDKFIESHKNFEKYLNKIGITGLNSNVEKVLGDIKKLNGKDMVNILSKKTSTYDLASQLIDAWVKENKEITGPFKSIAKVENPFVAITLFAIAQAGLNPIFYKVTGNKTGAAGSYTEFPTKATVDSKSSTQDMRVIDSAEKAGFQLTYTLKLNKHVYKTTLDFTYSSTVIKVEVVLLKEIK